MSTLDPGKPGKPDEDVPAVVYCAPCIYCRTPILAESFLPWVASPRLLTAACHGCLRPMWVTASDLAEMSQPCAVAALPSVSGSV